MDSENNRAESKPRDKESLREFKKRMMGRKQAQKDKVDVVEDEYENSSNCKSLVRKSTGIIYDECYEAHKCEWDSTYPENPERYTSIMSRLKELNLLDSCTLVTLDCYEISFAELVHSVEHIEALQNMCLNYDKVQAEEISSQYDAIYYNKDTFHCAERALSGTLSLVRAIAKNEVQNGLAVVRPPGHHAQYDEYNGYCFFNNVSIAAKYLHIYHKFNKILIVDFDVHHGQGTQEFFYHDNNVLYFSIHRYENGSFWPNLRESSFDYIGEGEGAGYNINVPLNTTGLGDADYLAIVTHILLPVAYEFQPDMIIFSAGFDACIGCPEGKMEVSPGFYGHLIKLLSGLAQGRLAVILEGGYFLPSLAEGVAMTLQALLDNAPAVLPPLGKPHDEVITVINNLKFYLHNYWNCFRLIKLYDNVDRLPIHKVELKYLGVPDKPPYATRNCYPVQSTEEIAKYTSIVEDYKRVYGKPVPNTVCYAYHEDMCLHTVGDERVEVPHRIKAIHERFIELGLQDRCKILEITEADVEALASKIHSCSYISELLSEDFVGKFDSSDMYWNPGESVLAVKKAVSAVISVADAVINGDYSSGVAVIRPPGHHAEFDSSLGFCFINNIAVAANYLVDSNKAKRVLIVDFDIHHGNGTQQLFYDTSNVLYISIHKYDYGSFYPHSKDGADSCVGVGPGKGFNVNVPFNADRMGDVEYLLAFFKIVLPIAYEYAPDIILVSAGFDAGVNDLLGNYKVHPETFGHMIQLLKPLAKGRIVVVLEGGYNLTTLKHSMNFCIKTLLGDPLPELKLEKPKYTACTSFNNVVKVQKQFWLSLDVDRPLSKRAIRN